MDTVRIASSDLLSTFYDQATALGRVLMEESIAKDVEIIPTTGSVMNAEMVARGDAELGFMASNWVPRAVQGTSPFSAPVAVAIAAPLNAGPLFFVVKADSPLTSVSQLRGRKVAVGHRDSGMAQHALNMVRVFGWGEDGMDFAFISTFDGGNALTEGQVDAQFQAPIPSTHFTELCERTPVRVLAYDNGEIETACDRIPFYSPAIVPGEFVPGQHGDMAAIGVLNVIVAAAGGDADFITRAISAYIRRASDIETMNPLFRGLEGLLARAKTQGTDALAPGDAPLHPSGVAAFREAGLLA